METVDLVQYKKQRLREELQKLVPPGFNLFPPPKNRGNTYDNLDKFLERDTEFLMKVGYLVPTNRGYDTAIQHLRYFGYPIGKYKEAENVGSFYGDDQLNKDLREACDYTIRFYDLAEITLARIEDEVDTQLKLIQNERDKEKRDLEKTEEKKQKASSFISGATSFRPGKSVRIKTTKIPGIIPKKITSQNIVDNISKPSEQDVQVTNIPPIVPKRTPPEQIAARVQNKSDDESISGGGVTSSLAKLSLNLDQTNENLEAIADIIIEDIKNSKNINDKEKEEYRKRIANRGRRIGKQDLGSSKVDVSNLVKTYAGNFFSGAGGAIRTLSLFNLLEGLMSGDPSKILGPLLGIGVTYLPAIGAAIAGLMAKKVAQSIFGGGGKPSVTPGGRTPTAPQTPTKLGKFGKFAAIASLGAGALSLGSAFLSNRDQPEDIQKERLSELEIEQKSKTEVLDKPSAIPDSDLKRFQELNLKFEKALDFLLKKQQEREEAISRIPSGGPGGGGGGGGGQLIEGEAPAEIDALMSAISGGEGGLESVNRIGAMPGLSELTIDEAIAKVESLRAKGKTSGAMGRMQQMSYYLKDRAIAAGLDPTKDKFNEENQYKIDRSYLASLFSGGEREILEMLKKPNGIEEVVRKLKGVWPSVPTGEQENVHTPGFYDRYRNILKNLKEKEVDTKKPEEEDSKDSKTTKGPDVSALPRNIPRIETPVSSEVNFLPLPINGGQDKPSQKLSDGDEGGSSIPNVLTTNPDNFLALNTKLRLQVVA
jgi:muramidase (phage lysozyme)